jgi:peptidoglycan/xylan/chitin deacetylase (PgdA/CDA1 family)
LVCAPLAAVPAAADQTAAGTPILVYHRFDPTRAGPTTVTTDVFESQLAWLARHRIQIVRLRDAVAGLSTPTTTPATRQTVLTVDDGHISVFTVLFPLIRKHGIPVTLFIYPSAISNASYAMTWDQLREMRASGLVDVQSHTYWHPNFKAERRRRTPPDYHAFVDNQLRRSKATLEARIAEPVDMLAWPFGIVDPDLEDAARAAGYRFAFAYEGGVAQFGDDPLALPRIPVTGASRGERFGALLSAPQRRTPT